MCLGKYSLLKIYIWSENFQCVRSWWCLMPTLCKSFFIIQSTRWIKRICLAQLLLEAREQFRFPVGPQKFCWYYIEWGFQNSSFNGSLNVVSDLKPHLSLPLFFPIKDKLGLHRPMTHWFSHRQLIVIHH